MFPGFAPVLLCWSSYVGPVIFAPFRFVPVMRCAENVTRSGPVRINSGNIYTESLYAHIYIEAQKRETKRTQSKFIAYNIKQLRMHTKNNLQNICIGCIIYSIFASSNKNNHKNKNNMNTATNTQDINVNKAIAVFFAAVTLVSVIVCVITKATA